MTEPDEQTPTEAQSFSDTIGERLRSRSIGPSRQALIERITQPTTTNPEGPEAA